jgi:Flp pilus assembly protein TadD
MARARHLRSAHLLVAAGHPASALVVLDEAPRPVDVEEEAAAETVRGTALLHLHQAGLAESAFRRAIRAGDGGGARASLGLLLLERGARGEAEHHLRAAVEGAPELDAAWSGLGVLAALEGRSAEAVALLERALVLNPTNPDASRALAVLRGDAGEVRHEHA